MSDTLALVLALVAAFALGVLAGWQLGRGVKSE